MTLGALIAQLGNESDASATIEALGDLVLYTEIATAAEKYGETPGEYLASSVGQFATEAADEEWLGLIAAMERSADPGKAVICRISRWAIARDQAQEEPGTAACSCET